MPQIAQLSATYASQIFWALIFFGFVFFAIGRGMVPKVMATMATRDKQIADDLGISIKTVEAHRANIMEKLNVNTVADLLRLALSRNS